MGIFNMLQKLESEGFHGITLMVTFPVEVINEDGTKTQKIMTIPKSNYEKIKEMAKANKGQKLTITNEL